MTKILRIAQREYLATVKTKGFIIGLVLAPVLMCGSIIAMALLRNQVDTKDRVVAVVDRSAVIAPAILEAAKARNDRDVFDKAGKKLRPAFRFEVLDPGSRPLEALRLELSDQIRSGRYHAFLEIGPEVVQPGTNAPARQVAYYAKNAVMDDIRRWLGEPINNELRKRRLAAAGIDTAKVPHLFNWAQVDGMGLASRDAKTGAVSQARRSNEAEAIATPMLATVLMFMLIMMGVTPLLQVLMEEKTQRIAEVMLATATPFQLMFGKVLGGAAVSLTGSLVYVFGTASVLTGMAMGNFVPWSLLPWFYVYLVAATFMFGSAMAAVGSVCSDTKDLQSLQMPAMLPMIIPMFVLGPVIKEPHSMMSTVLSLIPPFTPTLMMMRQAMPGGVPWWQPVVGCVGVVAAAIFAVWASGRIFRVGILLQGKAPKFTELLRWVVKG